MEARIHVAILLQLLLVFSSFHANASAQVHQLSDGDIKTLLEDLRGKGFFTGATVLSYVARSFLAPSTTLLIPTDEALAQAVSIEPTNYEELIKFHILETDLDFDQLKVLPVGTWIPTTLQGFGVEVSNNSGSDFALNNAKIIDADICARVIGVSCQGVSAVLDPKSKLSERPNNPPLSASAPTPSQSSTSPSPSPLASTAPSALVSPLQFSSPSSSPSLSPSSSPSPSPSVIEPVPLAASPPSGSPLGAISPVPSSSIFQAPIPSPISPSPPFEFPPFFADAPAPGPSATSSGATVASQINMLTLATLGGIILAMI